MSMSSKGVAEIEEDRLSSLPVPILMDIVSRLDIKEAAATSVLSHGLLHLWTGVTRLESRVILGPDPDKHLRFIVKIHGQLTSRKLHVFDITLPYLLSSHNCFISCFRELCFRNGEHVCIATQFWNRSLFQLPRGSSACEILLTDGKIEASSNDPYFKMNP